jgi:hypothetical protein
LNVQHVVLVDHNFVSPSDNLPVPQVVSVLAATNAAFAPTAVTAPIKNIHDGYPIAVHSFSSNQLYRYWRISVNVSAGYFDAAEIGYIYMGVSTDVDYLPTFRIGYQDPSKSVYSISGQRAAFVRDKYRTVSLATSDLEDMDLHDAIEAGSSQHEDFILMLDPAGDQLGYGTLPGITGPLEGVLRYTLYGHITRYNMQHRTFGASRATINFEEAR